MFLDNSPFFYLRVLNRKMSSARRSFNHKWGAMEFHSAEISQQIMNFGHLDGGYKVLVNLQYRMGAVFGKEKGTRNVEMCTEY
jgi:hypothetical protein